MLYRTEGPTDWAGWRHARPMNTHETKGGGCGSKIWSQTTASQPIRASVRVSELAAALAARDEGRWNVRAG